MTLECIILAGGLGTRLAEETAVRPKPMVEIGGKPILLHIMEIFARQGVQHFVIAAGYKKEVIHDYFQNFHLRRSEGVTYSNRGPSISPSESDQSRDQNLWSEVSVTVVDTGQTSETGWRVKLAMAHLRKTNSDFFLTYGDGLANVDLEHLRNLHRLNNAVLTVTAVRPTSRFGNLEMHENSGAVERFVEKPKSGSGLISGGFFVASPQLIPLISSASEETNFEKDVIPGLVEAGKVSAVEHTGYWRCMDTLRDKIELDDIAKVPQPPWLDFNSFETED